MVKPQVMIIRITCCYCYLDLRKQARRLETEIDSMLVSLSKISTNNPMMYGDDESQLLLSDDRFETATSEIEELLSKVKLLTYE